MPRTAVLTMVLLLCFTTLALGNDSVRHYNVGELDILALRDADVSMPKKIMPGIDKYPSFAGIFEHGPVAAVDQTFYFRNGDHRTLIDGGWGDELTVKGHTESILRDAGIQPEEITDILLTHMDHDHIGGLIKNGKPVYPNAVIWVSKPEYEAWINGKISNRPESSIGLAKQLVSAYKIKQFDFGDELMPGVFSVDASGHTPGHTAYDIISGNDKFTVAGDILHLAPIQLPHPELSTIYDIDPQKAAATRERLLNRAAQDKSLFAGMHFPMISDVRKIPDNGYVMKQPR